MVGPILRTIIPKHSAFFQMFQKHIYLISYLKMHGSESFLYHLDPLVFLFLLPILGFINEGRIEPQSQEGVLENSVPTHSRQPKCSWGFFRGEVADTCIYIYIICHGNTIHWLWSGACDKHKITLKCDIR